MNAAAFIPDDGFIHLCRIATHESNSDSVKPDAVDRRRFGRRAIVQAEQPNRRLSRQAKSKYQVAQVSDPSVAGTMADGIGELGRNVASASEDYQRGRQLQAIAERLLAASLAESANDRILQAPDRDSEDEARVKVLLQHAKDHVIGMVIKCGDSFFLKLFAVEDAGFKLGYPSISMQKNDVVAWLEFNTLLNVKVSGVTLNEVDQLNGVKWSGSVHVEAAGAYRWGETNLGVGVNSVNDTPA